MQFIKNESDILRELCALATETELSGWYNSELCDKPLQSLSLSNSIDYPFRKWCLNSGANFDTVTAEKWGIDHNLGFDTPHTMRWWLLNYEDFLLEMSNCCDSVSNIGL